MDIYAWYMFVNYPSGSSIVSMWVVTFLTGIATYQGHHICGTVIPATPSPRGLNMPQPPLRVHTTAAHMACFIILSSPIAPLQPVYNSRFGGRSVEKRQFQNSPASSSKEVAQNHRLIAKKGKKYQTQ
jgi:hypothetical protein